MQVAEAPKAARVEVVEAAAKKTEASANANAPEAAAAASSSTPKAEATRAAGDEDDEEIVITSLATETPMTTPTARVAAAVDLGRCRQLNEASCFAADLACCRQLSEVDLAELKRAAAAVQRGAPSMSFQGDEEGRAFEDDGGAATEEADEATDAYEEASDLRGLRRQSRCLGRQSRWAAAAAARKLSPPHLPCGDTEE